MHYTNYLLTYLLIVCVYMYSSSTPAKEAHHRALRYYRREVVCALRAFDLYQGDNDSAAAASKAERRDPVSLAVPASVAAQSGVLPAVHPMDRP